MKERISVIVPVYNVAAYLPRCVESILNQSYTSLQIILVDDGSTDESGSICDSYLSKDPRIHVVHQKNGGLSAARNTGIEHADGTYLSFIDADDYLHPEFYQRLHDAMAKNAADIAVCKFKQVSTWTETDSGYHQEEVFQGRQAIMENFYNKKCTYSVSACNKLYKRSLFKTLRYTPGIIHEDEDLTYRVFYECACTVYLSDTLYYYYARENSITTKRYSQRNLQIFDILKSVIQFYNAHKETSMEKKATIRYFKMLKLHMLRVEQECRRNYEDTAQNEIYRLLQSSYKHDLRNYHMYYYKPLFDAYGFLKKMKGSR